MALGLGRSEADAAGVAEPREGFFNGSRGKLLIGLVLILAALGYFGFSAFQFEGATRYYLTVAELKREAGVAYDKEVRVVGKLVPESFQREGTLARFVLTQGGEFLPATYEGVLPDLFFNEHSEIVLEGKYGRDGVFQAHTVIVKCPSKYSPA